jgi:uncharacterized protein
MILLDSGYWIALFDASDARHERALRLRHTRDEGWITTWPVISESVYLLESHVHLECALSVLDAVADGFVTVWDIPSERLREMKMLMQKYSNLPMDLADASMVLLAEHLGHGRILTTDQRDFGAYRWKSQKPFVDLMAELT